MADDLADSGSAAMHASDGELRWHDRSGAAAPWSAGREAARDARRPGIQLVARVRCAPRIGSLWALFPFLWMISTSLKSDSQVLIYPPAWIPSPPSGATTRR